MTIDRAIKREQAKAEEYRAMSSEGNAEIAEIYIRCSKYHEQLAEWLEELKKRRSEDYGYMADIHQSIGYRKALDDIKEELMKNGFIYTQHALDVFNDIAEQLKAGESDGNG